MSMVWYDYNDFNLWSNISGKQRLFSTQCILIAELDDVRSERGGDCFQPKRNCGISFRTYVGDWGDVLVSYIHGVQKKLSFTDLSICRFATNIISISSQLAAGSPNAQVGITQFFETLYILKDVHLQMVNLIYRQEMLQSQTATSHVRSIGSELRPSQGENRAFDETQQKNRRKLSQLNQKAPKNLTRSSFQGVYLWGWGSRPQVSILDMTSVKALINIARIALAAENKSPFSVLWNASGTLVTFTDPATSLHLMAVAHRWDQDFI